jgi:deoxycytidine triphosphate deaminase
MNGSMRAAPGDFVIRLRKRSGSERMGRNPHPHVFEVGFIGRKGGAIAVYIPGTIDLTDTDELERLFAIALEKWSQERSQIVARGSIIALPGAAA